METFEPYFHSRMYTLLIGKLREEQKNTLFKFNQKNSSSEEEKSQNLLDDFPGILLQVLLRRTKNIFILLSLRQLFIHDKILYTDISCILM